MVVRMRVGSAHTPCMALHPICRESARCSWSHVRLVEQKMSTREPPGSLRVQSWGSGRPARRAISAVNLRRDIRRDRFAERTC